MADTKISALSAATALAGTEAIPVVQGGATVKATPAQMAAYTNFVLEATNTVAQRNGTAAQVHNLYNTYTDASNYERGFMRYVSNQLEIGHEAAGTGSIAREIKIVGPTFKFGTAANPANGFYATTTSFSLCAGVPFSWSSSTTNAGTGFDVGIARVAAGVIKVTNGSSGAGVIQTPALTVATLPAAATAGAGARSFVTDANATTFLSTVAGGGANKVPVVSDGTNWLIG